MSRRFRAVGRRRIRKTASRAGQFALESMAEDEGAFVFGVGILLLVAIGWLALQIIRGVFDGGLGGGFQGLGLS